MSSARLRKVFRYPSEEGDSDDDIVNELDEEEQEKLIARLRQEDEKRNHMYKRIFLAIPLISATIFVPTLTTSPSLQVKLISLLAISSLLCTAYVLLFLPNSKPAKDRGINAGTEDDGPVRRYLSYVNGVLSIMVGLNAFQVGGKNGVEDDFWLFCMLPSVVFSIVILARRTMISVDIEGLEKLKYPYKGA